MISTMSPYPIARFKQAPGRRTSWVRQLRCSCCSTHLGFSFTFTQGNTVCFPSVELFFTIRLIYSQTPQWSRHKHFKCFYIVFINLPQCPAQRPGLSRLSVILNWPHLTPTFVWSLDRMVSLFLRGFSRTILLQPWGVASWDVTNWSRQRSRASSCASYMCLKACLRVTSELPLSLIFCADFNFMSVIQK